MDYRLLKYFICTILSLLITLLGSCERCHSGHSSLYKRLQGNYQIVLESSSIDRSFEVLPSDAVVVTMQIQKSSISLPNFKSYTNEAMSLWGYSWKVVSSNPDSIQIEAYPHSLHGKYKVTFNTVAGDSLGYTSVNLVYLDNDSTHLCFMKVK